MVADSKEQSETNTVLEAPDQCDYVPLPNISYSEYLAEKIANYDSSLLALIDAHTGLELTYAQLNSKCHALASVLLQSGTTVNDVACVWTDNCPEMVISIVAATYLGLTFASISPLSLKLDFVSALQASHGTILFIGSRQLDVLRQVLDNPVLSRSLTKLRLIVELDGQSRGPSKLLRTHERLADKSVLTFAQALERGAGQTLATIPAFSIDPDYSQAHFCYASTSGTTGQPKKIVHSHRSILAAMRASQVANRHGLRMAQWTTMAHTSGMLIFNVAFNSGFTLVLFHDNNLDFLMASSERLRINSIMLSPDLCVRLAMGDYHKRYDLTSLAMLMNIGSKLAPQFERSLLAKFGPIFMNVYGASECAYQMVPDTVTRIEDFVHGSCGRIRAGSQMKIVDLETGSALPVGERGEICFRGPHVFWGYLDNPEETNKTIDAEGWYHSGDLGHVDAEGRLFVDDRIRELIKYASFTIAPCEIEAVLCRHSAVAAACVVGVDHIRDVKWLRAYVQLKPGASASEQELCNFVATNLAEYKQLRAGVHFVAEMPRNMLGKIVRAHFKTLVKSEFITD